MKSFWYKSNGIAEWLKLALAADDGCGIAAGLDVGLPARFLWANLSQSAWARDHCTKLTF